MQLWVGQTGGLLDVCAAGGRVLPWRQCRWRGVLLEVCVVGGLVLPVSSLAEWGPVGTVCGVGSRAAWWGGGLLEVCVAGGPVLFVICVVEWGFLESVRCEGPVSPLHLRVEGGVSSSPIPLSRGLALCLMVVLCGLVGTGKTDRKKCPSGAIVFTFCVHSTLLGAGEYGVERWGLGGVCGSYGSMRVQVV